MKKLYSDLRAGGILFLVSLVMYFVLIPAQIKLKGNEASLAADFFPKLLIIIIGFCGLLLAGFSAYDLYRNKERARTERAGGAWKTDYKAFIPHLTFLVTAIVYLVLMQYLGFILSSIPFLVFLLWHFGRLGFVKNCILAILYVPVVYYIFNTGFRIRFPIGPFGF